jgi:N4-gp56 family major capsid protein
MATNTTSAAGLSSQYQRYLSRQLLEKILPSIHLSKFALKKALPGKQGSKTMRFFRFAEPSTANIQSVGTEGTTPSSSDKSMTLETVDADLVQYVQQIVITDILSATELFNHTEEAIRQHGEDAALHCDNIIRNELASNTTGKNVVFSGDATTFSALSGDEIDEQDILLAATKLKQDGARPVDGVNFAASMPTEVAFSILNNTSGVWQGAAQYSAPENLYSGEIGRLFGVRVMETNKGFRSDVGTQYTYDGAGAAFSTFVFGKDAYGVPELNSQSPFAPQVLIADGPDKSDPAALKKVISYKTFYTAKILQPKHVCEIYSTINEVV